MEIHFPRRLSILALALGFAACQPNSQPPAPSEHPAPAPQSSLAHRYSFTDSAQDSVGNIDGVLKGGAKIAGGKLVLDNGAKGSDDPTLSYLEFPKPLIPKTGGVSIAVWFTATDAQPFARLLDFADREGAEGRAFIYLTPRTGADQARAAISATDTTGRIFVDADKLDDGKPHMLALVVDDKKLHLFVDGKEPAEAADLGENTLDKVRPVNNWVGRSSFDQDPGLSASIDEIRVYDGALTNDQMAAIFKAGPRALPQP